MTTPQRRTFTRVHGTLTHDATCGDGGNADTVVIVPGLGCASWMYRRLAGCLAEHVRVVRYDPPGHGLSRGRGRPRPLDRAPLYPHGIEDLTDHLATWMTGRGLQGATVLGHSLGGEVAIDLAARWPDLPARLVLLAPTGIPENPSVRVQALRFLQDLPLERPALWPRAAGAYVRAGLRRIYALARDQKAHMTGPLIPRVQCPVLILKGERDPVIRPWTIETLCELLPHAHAHVIPGGSHAIMDSRADEVAALTVAFMRDHPH
ncbi:alpha/beta fold hydrolase [Deinococcus maricopensis]|uniref:Alpha/beta hydrolase fold protein n=1 Tax=Deinococcus maricopensis (strain DSM 21211 / LMG 22137 / NRRL B-23946 / LB-34) TaxID=709986 RepID=E8U8Y1_DEIML|nr:alpha/beta hydrolase [Deinococcus maricopensis]ADV67520.1 alpha/beta hydrolase fold protein [Deinococcus maricopensis DSM 21211]